jgi:hypothetical protein
MRNGNGSRGVAPGERAVHRRNRLVRPGELTASSVQG